MTNLQRIRLDRGLALRQLALELGLSHQTLWLYEHGRINEPHPANAKKLRDWFGLPVSVLLSEDGGP